VISILSAVELGSAFILLIVSWIAGSKASRLINGGSPERLFRKIRKQLVWVVFATVPAAAAAGARIAIIASPEPVMHKDRALLHLALIAVPALGIWLLAVPKLWRLWRKTAAAAGAPLPSRLRSQAADPFLVVPFRAAALGAAALLYFALTSQVPLQLSKTAPPLVAWLLATAGLWLFCARRARRIVSQEAATAGRPLDA